MVCTVKSRFNESRFNVKFPFKVQNLVTKMEFHIKKSQFKESKFADGGHLLNRDFTVLEKTGQYRDMRKVQIILTSSVYIMQCKP